jgi:glutamine---fructose-6-phosphate transaminase (isomerizing)
LTTSEAPFQETVKQMEAQTDDLTEYSSYLRSLKLENVRPEDAVFCGAGDSLACARFAERLMNFKPRSFDPYDAILYPDVFRDKKVFFISVSGRTKSNIQAANIARRKGARETIAITANPESELAKSCSDFIELRFTKSGELTPGTNSFTASLLACGMLFKNTLRIRAANAIANAKSWAKEIVTTSDSTFHFVGSGSFYAIAMYGAAKIYEFAGSAADYQLMEEFSHLNLFSLKGGNKDHTIILRFGSDDEKGKMLDATLTQAGFSSFLMPIEEEREHVLQRAIYYSIHLQYLALNIALLNGLKAPSFLTKTDSLKVSNKMIY